MSCYDGWRRASAAAGRIKNSQCYDRAGRPMSDEDWARALQDTDGRRIARTELPDGKLVSTVWLGLDHRLGVDGSPLIFETMVFPSSDSLEALDCERYSTEEEARAGHLEMVLRWARKEGGE